jgi:ribosomal protein L19E
VCCASRFPAEQWLDPNEISEISLANSRQNVLKLVKDGFVLRKPNIIHSRSRVQRRNEAVAKGRHTGHGKRRGSRDARLPTKVVFIRRLRILRRMIKKYRDAKKIDKHTCVPGFAISRVVWDPAEIALCIRLWSTDGIR